MPPPSQEYLPWFLEWLAKTDPFGHACPKHLSRLSTAAETAQLRVRRRALGTRLDTRLAPVLAESSGTSTEVCATSRKGD